jgi:hypothetical protein
VRLLTAPAGGCRYHRRALREQVDGGWESGDRSTFDDGEARYGEVR